MRSKYSNCDKEKVGLNAVRSISGNSINERKRVERVYFKRVGERSRAQRHLRAFDFNRTTVKAVSFYNAKDVNLALHRIAR